MVLGYPTSISFLLVNGWSTDPRVLGHHSVLLAPGLVKIGGSVRYCLITAKAWSHSSFQPAILALIRVIKKMVLIGL